MEVTENEVSPKAPREDPDAQGAPDANADGGYSDTGGGLPNHNALVPQPGETGAPDRITHFKVIAGGISIPQVFVDSDGKTGVTSEGKYRGDIIKREEVGDEERIAHLLGLKAIEPITR